MDVPGRETPYNGGPARLAGNNGGFAVKHITLIRLLHTGCAQLEMQLMMDMYTFMRSHTHTHTRRSPSPKSLNSFEKRPHLREAIKFLIILLPKEYLTSG